METTMESTMIDDLREEKHIWGLLKHIFLAEPKEELLKDLLEVNIAPGEGDIERGLVLLMSALRENKDRLDDYIEDLAVEFARLFIGPKSPPAVPYASFYLTEAKTVMSDVTIDIRKRYLEAGMVVRDLYSTPDDHIGIELEFVSHLADRIIKLFEDGQRAEASRLFEVRSNFLNDHMALWVPSFADMILEHAEDDFYKGAALILRGAIEEL